jgi:hypothetical protein
VLFYGLYGISGMIISLTMQNHLFYAGYSVGHSLDPYVVLPPMDKREDLATGCSHLERVTRDIYNQCSWRFDLRLTC